jgi:small subunit ribosomal protein S15
MEPSICEQESRAIRANYGITEEVELISAETKKRVIEEFGQAAADTGTTEVQVALLTERLTQLSDHFKVHAKDHHSRRGLLKIVSHRRRLLSYLAANDFERYQRLIERLGLRR